MQWGEKFIPSVLVRGVAGSDQILTSLSKKAVMMNQALVIGAQNLILPEKIMISVH